MRIDFEHKEWQLKILTGGGDVLEEHKEVGIEVLTEGFPRIPADAGTFYRDVIHANKLESGEYIGAVALSCLTLTEDGFRADGFLVASSRINQYEERLWDVTALYRA